MLLRRQAWNLSPLQKFVKAGLWILLTVNILLWVYYVIPHDTSAKEGSCEASSTSQYSLPTATGAPETPNPVATPVVLPSATSLPTEVNSQKAPALTSETRNWTCRQPGPSSIVVTAAVVLGVFVAAEMLVIFGAISFGAGAWNFSAGVQGKDEVALTHENAKDAADKFESDV